jgi:hypothetical protein
MYSPAPSLVPLPRTAMVGQWEEYWGVGDNSDVTYNDIYDITLDSNDEIQMTVVESPQYKFRNIVFDGRNLSFQLDNNGFLIDYALTFGNDLSLLTGIAETSADKRFRIVWAKIK